ncbi:hypothetical protein [Amycolatopsis saalfeldensis]|uniref:Uncharacterized protein n=1 Tax=Amycolatopsis saalfeldensis TaxID=394193 RepID=A0A1H8XV87_9PSEU|nr:hypothetical protein [Amycolatopsis saalfeldensis]SEP43799.1 hypothetical protein SAMN04489732_109106 [Amycolatopsis saalfeldensis]
MEPFLPVPQPVRWRRGVYAAALVIPFTVAQVWALLVLLSVAPLDGLVGQAFLVSLVGSLVAVAAGWRWTWLLTSERRRERDRALELEGARYLQRAREFDRDHAFDRDLVARRLTRV